MEGMTYDLSKSTAWTKLIGASLSELHTCCYYKKLLLLYMYVCVCMYMRYVVHVLHSHMYIHVVQRVRPHASIFNVDNHYFSFQK